MDIRLEVIRLDGVWTLSDNGPELRPFLSEQAAISAGISAARQHHELAGGTATVHLWRGPSVTVIFDTRSDDEGPSSHTQALGDDD